MGNSANANPQFSRFPSRRSVVHSINGMVACSQPLAAQAGIRILMEGGNAADAAVAVAAALNVTEPASTGIGGDMFCLYFDPETKKVHSLNGSGRSPAALTLAHALATIPPEAVKSAGGRIPRLHPHAVTVPGAAAGWCDTVEKFGSGKLTLEQILAPAIALAEDGFPVSAVSADLWRLGVDVLKAGGENYGEMLLDGGVAPREGEYIRLPGMADTFRELAKHGKKGFYEGKIAEAIVKAVKDKGGVLTLDDLKRHAEVGSEEMEPISIDVPWGSSENEPGVRTMWECAPNGQGLVALQTLGILKALEKSGAIPQIGTLKYTHNSVEYLHALITALRLAFSDAHDFITDPTSGDSKPAPLKGLLADEYLEERSRIFSQNEALPAGKIPHGSPPSYTECDTVYFAVADRYGGGCSFINSVFSDFGSGIIPRGYSFPLHNRGCGFLLGNHTLGLPPSPNLLAPNKRPYHTIIPALLTHTTTTSGGGREPELDTIFGVMGAYMQPQGHVQVLLNLLAFGMSPQEALDAPRICLAAAAVPGEVRPGGKGENGEEGVKVLVEEGMDENVLEGLRRLGYVVMEERGWERRTFGRGQVVRVGRREVEGRDGGRRTVRVLSGGSDLRGDGGCVGY